MSCTRPLAARRMRVSGEFRFGMGGRGEDATPLELPCGKCIGCKMDQAREWKLRIEHESKLWDSNLFVTFTYDDAHLPPSMSLEYSHFQGFMKRLRKRMSGVSRGPKGDKPIRFFVAGEYGEVTERPHFHAVLFNTDFKDKIPWTNDSFQSTLATELWQCGHVTIGALTPGRAAYVAGYMLEKVEKRYPEKGIEEVVSPFTGEIFYRRAQFHEPSRNPGLGAWFYERYSGDLFPGDFAVMQGQKYKVPRYYVKKFKAEADPGQVEELMEKRYQRALLQKEESTPARRAVREELSLRRQAFYSERGL